MSADDDGTGDVTMADPRNPGGDAEFEEIREQVRTKLIVSNKRLSLPTILICSFDFDVYFFFQSTGSLLANC